MTSDKLKKLIAEDGVVPEKFDRMEAATVSELNLTSGTATVHRRVVCRNGNSQGCDTTVGQAALRRSAYGAGLHGACESQEVDVAGQWRADREVVAWACVRSHDHIHGIRPSRHIQVTKERMC